MTNDQKLCNTIEEIGQARADGKTPVIPFPDGLLVLNPGLNGFGTSQRPDGITINVKLDGVLYPETGINLEVPE